MLVLIDQFTPRGPASADGMKEERRTTDIQSGDPGGRRTSSAAKSFLDQVRP